MASSQINDLYSITSRRQPIPLTTPSFCLPICLGRLFESLLMDGWRVIGSLKIAMLRRLGSRLSGSRCSTFCVLCFAFEATYGAGSDLRQRWQTICCLSQRRASHNGNVGA